MITNLTEEEIQAQADKALEKTCNGETSYPAMTYEHGVLDTLRWLFSSKFGSAPAPMEDE